MKLYTTCSIFTLLVIATYSSSSSSVSAFSPPNLVPLRRTNTQTWATVDKTELVPPASTEEMMKSADATAMMYDKNVQKTYG